MSKANYDLTDTLDDDEDEVKPGISESTPYRSSPGPVVHPKKKRKSKMVEDFDE